MPDITRKHRTGATGSCAQWPELLPIQIMYGLGGERRLTEWQVPWLPGYGNSFPVRIGNAAHSQRQLDIFGEVMDALHQARQGGLGANEAGWALQRQLLAHLETIWQEPDEGLWEVRGGPEHFTHSKAMAWLAFDRTIRSAEAFDLPGPIERWRKVRADIHHDVCKRGFDAELGSFMRTYGSKELDASLLLLPAIGFLPPRDPRIVGTVTAIEDHSCDTASYNATILRFRKTDYLRAKVCFLPVVSGLRMPILCLAVATMPWTVRADVVALQ